MIPPIVPRALVYGEVAATGRHAVRWSDAPILPHEKVRRALNVLRALAHQRPPGRGTSPIRPSTGSQAIARRLDRVCHDAAVISFIVPAHNEAQLLGATLDALHAAARPLQSPCETIVVNDASTDDTAEIARAHGAQVVTVEHRHIAAARNAGARHARGDRLVFVDADTLVDAALVQAAIDALDDGASGGGAAVRFQGVSRWQKAAESFFVLAFRVTRIAPGCFVFCTRAAFEAAGGFDERYFAGEDVAISRALARHGRFVILRHAARTSARKLRTFTLTEHLRLVLRFAVRGRRVLRSRRDLDLWYGTRRDERR